MKNALLLISLIVVLIPLFLGCGGGGSDGGGGGCDLVANANSTSFLEVENVLPTGIEWYLQAYAFGAFLRPGECTQFGIQPNTTFELVITRCTSPSDTNCPNIGTTRTIYFSANSGEIYSILVNDSFF